MLIVVSLLGILATGLIALINPVHQLKISRDAKRKSDLRQIQAALELFRADCGRYPAPVSNAVPNSLTSASCPGYTGPGVVYMQSVPTDPKTRTAYSYTTSSGGYVLSACLENINDPDGSGTCPSGRTYAVNSP